MKSKVVFLIISILLLVIVANDNTKSQDSCISTNIILTTQVEYSEIEGITEELDNIEELLVSENDFGCEYYYTAELTYDPSLHTDRKSVV